jgi:hypothetical protein
MHFSKSEIRDLTALLHKVIWLDSTPVGIRKLLQPFHAKLSASLRPAPTLPAIRERIPSRFPNSDVSPEKRTNPFFDNARRIRSKKAKPTASPKVSSVDELLEGLL